MRPLLRPADPGLGRPRWRRCSATGPMRRGQKFVRAWCAHRRGGPQGLPSREAADAALRKPPSTPLRPTLVVLAGFMRIPRRRFHGALCGAFAQHPPLAVAQLPGPAHPRARHRGRLPYVRRHRSLRDRTGPSGPWWRRRWCPHPAGRRCRHRGGIGLKLEHRMYPQAVRWFVEGQLSVEGSRVRRAAPLRLFMA